jgi:hypothetical protein
MQENQKARRPLAMRTARKAQALTLGIATLLAAVAVGATALSAAALPSSCSNNAIRAQQGATFLPECRAYEQVSPVDKGGFEVASDGAVDAKASGGAVAFASFGAFSGALSGATPNQYMAVRGGELWSTSPLTPPSEPSANPYTPVVRAISADFTKSAVVTNTKLTPDAIKGDSNLYIHNFVSDTYQLVATGPSADKAEFTPHIKGSANFDHVVFSEKENLASTPAPPPGSPFNNLYDWSAGQLGLVGVLPNDTVAPGGADSAHTNQGPVYRAVSEDGSRIYFSTGPAGNNPIYLRENDSTTAAITVSQRGASPDPEPKNGQFWYATPDGSKAYFLSRDQLTDETSVNPGGSLWNDLYQYDASNGKLTDLTPDPNLSDPHGAEVQTVMGTGNVGSQDSYVYFVANGVLASGATGGQANLYVWHDSGASSTITFIAGLDPGEFVSFYEQSLGGGNADTRISPNGRYFAFTSNANLTEYDNGGVPEIYLYDSATNSLSCASCDPTGAPPSGHAFFEEPLRNVKLEFLQNRALLDNGLLFFNSPDALVPRDENGRVDVYEYREGAPHLISSGQGTQDSLFADASTDGTDVFFVTNDQLVGQDADESYDLYDARIGGGLISQSPPASPPCHGEACRGPQPQAPGDLVPISSSFNGPGNPAPNHQRRKHHRKRHHRSAKARSIKHNRGGAK